MAVLYSDPGLELTDQALRISRYYGPWGPKTVPLAEIRQVRRYRMGLLTGRGRIWGGTGWHSWANWDSGRPRKRIGFSVELGRFFRPLITPDDPAALNRALRQALPVGAVVDDPDALID